MRDRRTCRLWIAGALIGTHAVVSATLASFALADDVLDDVVVDTVENTEAAVDDAVDTTTDVVYDAADDVVDDVVYDAADDVTGTLAHATGEIAGGSSGGSTGTGGGGNGATVSSQESPKARDRSLPAGGGGGGVPASVPSGDREPWVWEPVDRLRLYGSAGLVQSVRSSAAADDDPCQADPSLVCLGLLYGLGDYAKSITTVLGVLAMTGVGLLGLMAIALALATTGSGALIVARHRSPATGRGW